MSTEMSSPGDSTESTPPAPEPAATAEHASHAGWFYRVDSSRSSFTELWRDMRSPVVLLAWLSKLLRISLPGSVNDPNVVALHPFVVADEAVEDEIDPAVLEKFQPVLRELTGLGFGEPVYYLISDEFHHSRSTQAALLHRDGRSVARITHRIEGPQYEKGP